jgi:outer membrane protein assembly factor BamB
MKDFLLPVMLLIAWSCSSPEPQIHEWRGEDRKGIYHETNLLKVWPAEGPHERWYMEGIGSGFGSPVIAGDRLYVTGVIDSMAVLYCISLDGKMIWKSTLGKEWMTSFPGSRSAPTIVDDLIYVGSGMGNLYCLERETGTMVWSRDFKADFQGVLPRFGHSESAVVDGNRVFWTVGGEAHNVVALERLTGELEWSHPAFGERSAYHHPRLIALPGRKILVTFSAYHLMGFDAETGELLWSHEQDNYPLEERKPGYGDTHANTVLYDDGSIYYAAGDGNGGVRLDLSEDGSKITEVWRNPEFDSFMGGIVKIGEYIYGGGTVKKQLKSIHADTGQLADSLDIGTGAVIEADQMLYYYNWKGEMKLVGYDEGKMTEVSSFKITRGEKEHFSHPVIHRGVLYLRHGDVLMAFDINHSL